LQKNKNHDTICGVTTKIKNHLISIPLKTKLLWKAAGRVASRSREEAAAAGSITNSKRLAAARTHANIDKAMLSKIAAMQLSEQPRQT